MFGLTFQYINNTGFLQTEAYKIHKDWFSNTTSILTNTSCGFSNADQNKLPYKRIWNNTVQYTRIIVNRLVSIEYKRLVLTIYSIYIQCKPLQIHTYTDWCRPIQSNTNEYIVNGLVCIESVLKYVRSVFRKQYRISTYTDQKFQNWATNSFIKELDMLHTNAEHWGSFTSPLWPCAQSVVDSM